MSLNLAQGTLRCGKDRRQLWRIAAGIADEVRTALRVAMARGDLAAQSVERPPELFDEVLALLWKLTRGI